MKDYGTVKIPKGLAREIDEFVAKQCFGYTSRDEFVKDAVQRGLAKVKGVG